MICIKVVEFKIRRRPKHVDDVTKQKIYTKWRIQTLIEKKEGDGEEILPPKS